jgi:hypothetical protein
MEVCYLMTAGGINSPVELLAALAAAEAVVRPAGDGQVRVDAPPEHRTEELRRACQRWRWVLIWGAHGAETGYRWTSCSSCGSLTPLAKKPGGVCTITFGCNGRTVAIPLPIFALGGVPSSPEKTPAVHGG